MNKLLVALLAAALLASAGVSGCKSDPHETHIRTNISAAR
jgi:hypothetical protein